MTLRLIFLDFDGVIIESNDIKDQAFAHVFADYPAQLESIMTYHRKTQGLIRFDKFRHIAEHILQIPYTDHVESQWAKSFSDFVVGRAAECSYVPGAVEFLNYFKGRLPLVLVSINPPGDLNEVLKRRQLTGYFNHVHATAQKAQAMRSVLKEHQLNPQEAVFIGDALSDYQASLDVKVPFVGRNSGSFANAGDFPIFNDMFQIKELLCQNGV